MCVLVRYWGCDLLLLSQCNCYHWFIAVVVCVCVCTRASVCTLAHEFVSEQVSESGKRETLHRCVHVCKERDIAYIMCACM